MDNGITFRTVHTREDYELFRFGEGEWVSSHYEAGRLRAGAGPFFPELFLDLTIAPCWENGLPDGETVLVRCEGNPEGWELVLDRYGYVHFRTLGVSAVDFRVATPLTTFVSAQFRLALVVANVCHVWRESRWCSEALPYCRVAFLGAPTADGALCPLGEWSLNAPTVAPVPDTVHFPENGAVVSARAYNTVRFQLFEGGEPEPGEGPCVDMDFPDASRVFSNYDASNEILTIYTGSEFVRSDSYWLFARVNGAEPGRTRIRLYTTYAYAKQTPGMAPRFFWSSDRRVWHDVVTVEPTDSAGRFYPLVEAPAECFYLSTSFPFMWSELGELLETVEGDPFVDTEVIGESVGGHPLTLLTVTDPSVPAEEKRRVVMIIGQHSPMEIVGAHFIEPMLEYFRSRPSVLRSLIFQVVPVVNADCAVYGSDGMNLNLRNTNRCWFDDIQPETACVMERFGAEDTVDLFLDLHAGGCWRNHTLLRLDPAFLREHFGEETGGQLAEAQLEVNRLLEKHAGIRVVDGVDFRYRECGAKDWFKVRFPTSIACDLELSLCTYFDPVPGVTRPVDQASFAIVGRGIAAALEEFACGASVPCGGQSQAPGGK